MTTPDKPISLYRKLAAIAGAIGRLGRDGYNPQLKYKYATPAAVIEAVKPLLAEHNLAIVPQVSAVVKEATGGKTQSGADKVLTRVEMTFLLLDGDSGETLAVPWVGEGEDWSDKGIAKAQTIALRTFLIQLFQIPSGDEEHDPDARQATAPRQQQPAARPARTEYAPTGPEDIHEKRKRLAELRSAAVKARVAYKPPKSPGDMSALEVDAAINEVETLLGETASAEF